MGELEKASDDPLQSQESVGQAVSALALETESCFKKDCLFAAQDATGSSMFLAGTLKFSKEKYRVKVYKVDSSNPGKSKTYRIRYKGDSDGFITELEILAWKIMGKEVPGRLMGKRKPNQETFFEKIAENPWAKRGLILAVAGLGGASYVSNSAAANKSKDAANSQDKSWSGYQSAYDAHMASHDKSKNEATLSLVAALAAVGYGYYIGVFSEEE